MADKAPYKLTIKLSSARPDAISEALGELKQQMSDYDQSGEASTTLTIESYKESPLTAICEGFELWLYRYKIGIECEVGLKRPGVRPETVLALRATKQTPMDVAGVLDDDDDDDTPIASDGARVLSWLEGRERD